MFCFIFFVKQFISLKEIVEKILNDELIEALKDDPASSEFISLRVKEIIEDFLNTN